MPLLKPTTKSEKEAIRIKLDKGLVAEIKKYMEFAKIAKYDDFFDQATKFVFEKDKDWSQKKS